MFGYITIHKDEMKFKDYDKYRAYYCGVCHSLAKFGFTGQMTLSYDMTFLAILLSSLYEDETEMVKKRCVPHPINRHCAIINEYTDYAAAMNVLLTYYKLKDDWHDDKSVKANALAGLLTSAFKKAKKMYPRQAQIIKEAIDRQNVFESSGVATIDEAANPTGELLAAVFVMKQDEWQNYLSRMGFFLGKYIYIMDAYDDLEKDIKKKRYNPLISIRNEENFVERCKDMLTLLAAESSRAFESMPILDNEDILRNILYAGIWNKFLEHNCKESK